MSSPNKKRKTCHEDPHDTVARCVKDSTMLTLIVGPQPSFSEIELGEVDWEDEDANVVKLFVSWLYSQRINLKDHGVCRSFEDDLEVVDDLLDVPEEDMPDDDGKVTSHLEDGPSSDEDMVKEKTTADGRALLKLCIFADKRCAPKLGNLAIAELHKVCIWDVDLRDIVSAWNTCAPNSKLRSFIVDSMSLQKYWPSFNHCSFDLPTSFLTALLRKTDWEARSSKKWKRSWENLDLCQYHEHEEGTRCGVNGNTSEGSDSGDEQQHDDSDSDE